MTTVLRANLCKGEENAKINILECEMKLIYQQDKKYLSMKQNYWDPQEIPSGESIRNHLSVRNTKGFRVTEFLRPTSTLLYPRAQRKSA